MSDTETTLANTRAFLATRAAMASCYRKSWGDDFCMKEVQEAWNPKELTGSITVDALCEIPDDKLREFGFGSWDGALTLIPLWAWNLIADGAVLQSINGDMAIKGTDEIDLDVRFGCIAHGFKKPGAVPIPDDETVQ